MLGEELFLANGDGGDAGHMIHVFCARTMEPVRTIELGVEWGRVGAGRFERPNPNPNPNPNPDPNRVGAERFEPRVRVRVRVRDSSLGLG